MAKIFLDPLAEKGLEAEALLVERLKSVHLEGQLYWEKWKVKFLDEDEDDDDVEIYERNILAMYNE